MARKAICSRSFRRAFTTSPPSSAGSPLLNLSGLSVSRESQHLSKEYGIPRTEFSPYLELIRSSEVDPFQQKKNKPGTGKGGVDGGGLNTSTASAVATTATASTVAATYLINELTAIKTALRDVTRERFLLQQDLKRKNRDVLILSLFSTGAILALLFPEQRKAVYRWAIGSPRAEKPVAAKGEERGWLARYRASQDRRAGQQMRDSVGNSSPVSNSTMDLSSLLSPSAVTDHAEPSVSAAGSKNPVQKESRPSILSGLFWSSAPSSR